MARPLLPKDESDETQIELSELPGQRSGKRKCVSSACIPCRKRKSKCDGGTPNCSTCTAVYNTECEYNIDSDYRRKGAWKRDIESLRERNGALGVIVASIRTGSDAQVADIVHQIRSSENLNALAESLKKNLTLSAQLDSHSLEGDLTQWMTRSSHGSGSGLTRQYRYTSSLGLVPHDDQTYLKPTIPSESWTRVTKDAGFVGHLMSLYFAWQHPYYIILSKECFLHDMTNFGTKYCSPLLVNALLASACAFSDRREAWADPMDSSTAGDHFFTEAKRLLNEDSRSSLTVVQALAILSIREACCGRDSSGYRFAGRAVHMALELGLHLSPTKANVSSLTPVEIEVRNITFWGIFKLDNVWAICVGRIAQLPRAAISVEKPTVTEEVDLKPWSPYGDNDTNIGGGQPSHEQRLLQYSSSLAEIVNDTVFMFYAPTERLTSKRLLEFHSRYRRWETSLPDYMQAGDLATPHILCLHMYYHTVVLHLFRPFLKVDLLNSTVSPREICNQSARHVSSLANAYRRNYSLRCTCQIMSHCILSSSTIHLLNFPSSTASQQLLEAARNLAEMSQNHAFAGRCLRIIQSLAQKWGVLLPEEFTLLAAAAVSGHTLASSSSINFLFPASDTRASPQGGNDYSGSSNRYFPQGQEIISKVTSSQTNLFWTPFPDQGVPLQPTTPAGPMDISAMLDVQSDIWDQIGRDGFKLAYLHDPILGRIGVEADMMHTS